MTMLSTNQLHIDTIADDRRRDRRYPIPLELRWKVIHRRKVLDQGVGKTIDLSSGGMLFEANRHLPPGLKVEVTVSWPVLTQGKSTMQLVVLGRIVRSKKLQIAIRGRKHTFVPLERRVEHCELGDSAANAFSPVECLDTVAAAPLAVLETNVVFLDDCNNSANIPA